MMHVIQRNYRHETQHYIHTHQSKFTEKGQSIQILTKALVEDKASKDKV